MDKILINKYKNNKEIISCIYKITSPSNKVYIGSTINVTNRIKYYECYSCQGQVKLFNSIKKYGWESHSFKILEICDKELLYIKERYYGDLYKVLGKSGLNCILPSNGELKISISDDTRKKMSDAKIGNRNAFYNKKHTQETKNKIRESKIGKEPYNKGKIGVSDETRIKMSESAKNKEKIKCPYCDKFGLSGNMYRWHFDNCKNK